MITYLFQHRGDGIVIGNGLFAFALYFVRHFSRLHHGIYMFGDEDGSPGNLFDEFHVLGRQLGCFFRREEFFHFIHIVYQLALVLGGYGDDVVHRQVAQHARLNLDFLCVSFPFHFIARLQLLACHHAGRFEHGDARGLQVVVVKDVTILAAARDAIENGKEISLEYTIANTDRSVGAMLAGAVAKKYGQAGLPEQTIHIKFKGSAGQSFGAFLTHGISFKLEGEANDYLGKGLSGGRIAVLPPVRSNFDAEKNTIAGNTLLYGATDGEVYINGRVGERFAVRNSGVKAVVEGVGDHCCEYMTGGRVVVLGETGRNFAAGMSGGVAYVWDKNHNFDYFCNMEMVELSLIEEASYRKELHELIRQHYLYTGSKLARTMLDDWNRYVDEFIQVVPIEYKRVLQEEQMRKLHQKIADVQRDY